MSYYINSFSQSLYLDSVSLSVSNIPFNTCKLHQNKCVEFIESFFCSSTRTFVQSIYEYIGNIYITSVLCAFKILIKK